MPYVVVSLTLFNLFRDKQSKDTHNISTKFSKNNYLIMITIIITIKWIWIRQSNNYTNVFHTKFEFNLVPSIVRSMSRSSEFLCTFLFFLTVSNSES